MHSAPQPCPRRVCSTHTLPSKAISWVLIDEELRLSEVFLACTLLAVTLGGAHCPIGQGC